MVGKIPYTILLPACAVLVVLPFLAVPLLERWADSLLVCIEVGQYCLDMVPGSTLVVWGIIDALKELVYIGAFLGFIGFFTSLGRLIDVKSM